VNECIKGCRTCCTACCRSYNKSATNSSNGVWACIRLIVNIKTQFL